MDADEAVRFFFRLTDIPDDRLLSTSMVWRFLVHAIKTHAADLVEVISRMVASHEPKVAEYGATLAWAEWCMHGLSREMADACRNGSDSQRLGCAKAAEQLYDVEEYRGPCDELLKLSFQDGCSDVREAACQVLGVRQGEPADHLCGLMAACLQSPARTEGIGEILDTVEHTDTSITNFTSIILSLVRTLGEDLSAEERGSLITEAWQLPTVVLRLYEQAHESGDAETAAKCLNAIDLMIEKHIGDATRRISALLGWPAA